MKNRLMVGSKEQCKRKEFGVEKVNWINQASERISEQAIKVRIRHGGELVKARFERRKAKILVVLEKPVFGVAAGQSVVFYDDNVVLGGGTIV